MKGVLGLIYRDEIKDFQQTLREQNEIIIHKNRSVQNCKRFQ